MSIITSKRRGQAGFTLVEAMVAIAILSISITGPLVIAQKGIASAIYSRDQVTAFYLAQEAVEYIRNVRDTNGNKGDDWMIGLGECLSPGCVIDGRWNYIESDAILPVSGDVSDPLSMEGSSGLYGYPPSGESGWTPTHFRRVVTIVPQAADKEMIVSVKVSWNTTLLPTQKEFTVKEVLFNI